MVSKTQQGRETSRLKTATGTSRRTKQVVQAYTELATLLGFTPNTNNPREQWQEQIQPRLQELLAAPTQPQPESLTSAQRTSKHKRRIAELEAQLADTTSALMTSQEAQEKLQAELTEVVGKLGMAHSELEQTQQRGIPAPAEDTDFVSGRDGYAQEQKPLEESDIPELMPFTGHRSTHSQSNKEPDPDEPSLRLVCVVMTDGRGTFTPTFSYGTNILRDEMLGRAIRFAREQQPTFNVSEVLEAAISNSDLIVAEKPEVESPLEEIAKAERALAAQEASYRKMVLNHGPEHRRSKQILGKVRAADKRLRELQGVDNA